MPYLANIPSLLDDEWLYSYLLRLSYYNGVNRIEDFMKTFIHGNEPLGYDLFPWLPMTQSFFDTHGIAIDCCDQSITSFFFSMIPSNMQLQFFFIETYRECLKSFPKKHNGDFIPFVKRCPLCDKDAKYLRRSHQLPGVSVCHIHGCTLEKYTGLFGGELAVPEHYTPIENSVYGFEYATFCYELFQANLSHSFDELRNAIVVRCLECNNIFPFDLYIDKIQPINDIFDIHNIFFYPMESGFKKSCKENRLSAFLNMLLILFDDVSTLQRYLSMPAVSAGINDEKELFSSKIDGEYDVIDYSTNIVHLFHHKCKNRYYISTYLFLSGWECPCLFSTSADLARSAILGSYHGEYSLVSIDPPECFSLESQASIFLRHNHCNNVFIDNTYRVMFSKGKSLCPVCNQKWGKYICLYTGFHQKKQGQSEAQYIARLLYSYITHFYYNKERFDLNSLPHGYGSVLLLAIVELKNSGYVAIHNNNMCTLLSGSVKPVSPAALFDYILSKYEPQSVIYKSDLISDIGSGVIKAIKQLTLDKHLYSVSENTYKLAEPDKQMGRFIPRFNI